MLLTIILIFYMVGVLSEAKGTGNSMYICVCNALTETCVRNALTEKSGGVATVFGQHGTKPKCGKCLSHMKEFMQSHLDQSTVDIAKSG